MSSPLKKIFVVLGTRPELIKLAPFIKQAKENKNCELTVCATGQHRDLLIPLYELFQFQPDIDLNIMKPQQQMADVQAEVLKQVTEHLQKLKPDVVVVQGDTISAQAAATAAFYQKIPVAHIEAGLRTYDMHSPFPEEFNRRSIGLVSRWHFCATKQAAQNLKKEKVSSKELFITGNTTIDSLLWVDEKIQKDSGLKQQLENKFSFLSKDRKVILLTVHRRESWGDDLKSIFKSIKKIAEDFPVDIVFPVHPNPNVKSLAQEILGSSSLHMMEPLNYIEMAYMLRRCDFVMTDSGGVQEEAPSFGKKILVLRKKTERPEGIKAGFSKLVGVDSKKIYSEAKKLLKAKKHFAGKAPKNPFGDGKASQRILKTLLSSK